MSFEDGPTVTDWWLTKEICLDCDRLADHIYTEWNTHAPYVTTECIGCGAVREIQDNGR